ncbi:hypothetical protein LBMAG53_04960 [Planctomycetota bacterium]|nr:hypothetical protein LBMAG53_04960 [Planctomycetota bacterium]
MKTITIHVDELVLLDFQRYAKTHSRTTADMIREAMEHYRISWNQGGSLLDLQPANLGTCVRALDHDDDLLDEMLTARDEE